MTKAQRDIRWKLGILRHGAETGNVSKTCRYFGISQEIFYQWRRSFERHIVEGLINSNPCPNNPKLRIAPEIEEKIIYLPKTYQLGQLRISWFLERYLGIKVSTGGVYGVPK
jgi:hypothetical protein